jgi:chorismate mutase
MKALPTTFTNHCWDAFITMLKDKPKDFELIRHRDNRKPLIISGPCSAETREQVIGTASRLASAGRVHLLRAGIWKPRTKPGLFEGVGVQAFDWLREARQTTGLPFTTEVASKDHVAAALKAGTDVLWIGARTTANPFSVQEVADALQGADVPVLIKNPTNPDIDLWTGAVERIRKAGINRIGLIHRGFSLYGRSEYRNNPMWHIPIEMKRRYPELMMICDPSHICGNRHLLGTVAQKSIDLDFDGLMLESHIDPDHAWSDAKQQITPETLLDLLEGLKWRRPEISEPAILDELALLREQIDQIDDELLGLLSNRMRLADRIGSSKKTNNLTILQPERWNEILQRAFLKADGLGLSREFIQKYFDAVHMESINHQNKMMNG